MASSHTIRKKSSKSLSRLKRYKKRWRYIYIQVTLWQVVVFCCWALKWMALYWCVEHPKFRVWKFHWVIDWTQFEQGRMHRKVLWNFEKSSNMVKICIKLKIFLVQFGFITQFKLILSTWKPDLGYPTHH